jgi:hypothetical protein
MQGRGRTDRKTEETMRWLVGLLVCCGGCGSVQYQGWSPSFRWTRDDPGLQDVYVGADANFVLEDRSSAPRPTIAQDRPLDAWNTAVAWQPLTVPDASPVQEAGIDAAPALDANK